MRRRILLACGALLAAPAVLRAEDREAAEVDLLLVLAADISHSMQHAELVLQRQAYVAALRDDDVAAAIGSGPMGAIGLLYLEWSSVGDQTVLIPWTLLTGAEDAARLADRLAATPLRGGMQTSISGAIAAARREIATAPFIATRRAIDISGDGENNHGVPAQVERDRAVAEGITINGLPIIRETQRLAALAQGGPTELEQHYRDRVIGGFGAFVMPAHGFAQFAGAIRRKLVLEIAGGPAAGTGPA
jgi:hypothetical protein